MLFQIRQYRWKTVSLLDQLVVLVRSTTLLKMSLMQLLRRNILFHLPTLWLFTVSEHKTIVYPWTAFGVFRVLSGAVMTTNPSPDLTAVIYRVPRTLLWMWLVILVFTIANQSLEESVVEDAVNKPWRPLPSSRLTIAQARVLLLVVVTVVYLATTQLGASEKAICGMVLTWIYNDLKGSDVDYIIRNVINALGLTTWSIGATQVACGSGGYTINASGYRWLQIVGLIVFTTLQAQDFLDQEGDRKKGRHSAPLVWGDNIMRWITISTIMFWSIVSPAIWSLHLWGYIGPVSIGSLISIRLLLWRNPVSDERTWKLWELWMATLFSCLFLRTLPLSFS